MDAIKSIEKGNIILANMYRNHPELEEIKSIKERSISEDIQGDELSILLTKMSALIFRIGVIVSEVTNKANESYIYRKLKYMWEYNKLGNEFKVSEREAKTMVAIRTEYESELVNRYVADYMQTLYKDYDRFISVQQSRLALLRSEMYKL